MIKKNLALWTKHFLSCLGNIGIRNPSHKMGNPSPPVKITIVRTKTPHFKNTLSIILTWVYFLNSSVLTKMPFCFAYHQFVQQQQCNVFSHVCPSVSHVCLYSVPFNHYPRCINSHHTEIPSLSLPSHQCWHLVTNEACKVGASGQYASYWNAFLFLSVYIVFHNISFCSILTSIFFC